MKKYDVIVLGAGPGGYVAAIRAAQLGASVAVIEKNKVGGTCLNAGCIPTKALIKNVEILHSIEAGRHRGIKIEGNVVLDYSKAVKAKDRAVKQLVKGVSGLLQSNGVELYQGCGVLAGDKRIFVDNGNERLELEFGKLIIATGSSPKLPPVKGADEDGVVTSEELLACTQMPESLVIIGGGVIGCEFATIFNAYGCKVTIIEMLPTVVAVQDETVSEMMRHMLEQSGIEIKADSKVQEIVKRDDGRLNVIVQRADNTTETVSGDKVLISTGRKPNSEQFGLMGFEMDRGFISVNDRMETSISGIYAIGDVTGKRQLAHVASEMGICAAENAMGKDKKMSFDIIPACIYTTPEVGCVGLTEKEAKEKGFDVAAGIFPLVACGKAVASGDTDGMFKIVADKKTKKILGAHFIGRSATELVAEAAAYMKMNGTVEDIVETIHSHPTISEAVAEAARDVDNISIHMPKK